jgi:hypothetical protein
MIWAKRHLCEGEDYTLIRSALRICMALSLQFVMVAKRTGRGGWDIYIGLPDEFFRSQFDGFGPIDETELPREVDQILYASNQGVGSEFAKHFRIVESVTAQRFS